MKEHRIGKKYKLSCNKSCIILSKDKIMDPYMKMSRLVPPYLRDAQLCIYT